MDLSHNGRLDGKARSKAIDDLVGLTSPDRRSYHNGITAETVKAAGLRTTDDVGAALLSAFEAGARPNVQLARKLKKALSRTIKSLKSRML